MNTSLIWNTLAIGGGMIGSLLVASADMSLVRWGYFPFLVSSIAAAFIQSKHPDQRGLLVLSGFFIAINVWGIARWWGFV